MSHSLIIGAAGMLGQALARRLFAGEASDAPSKLTLFDVIPPSVPSAAEGRVEVVTGDLCERALVGRLLAQRPEVIYHLAAVVSGQAEADFELGYQVNLDATRLLLDEIRVLSEQEGYRPRLVFTSSLAVFGSPLPDVIPDTHVLMPRSSYGIQKAIGELLISDFSRKGYLDGISIRLPTIIVRPGKPNAAASSFFSGILREPLSGLPAILPVSRDVRHWFSSPRAAVEYLCHAAQVDLSDPTAQRALTMPGLSATVADLLSILQEVAGPDALDLIQEKPDARIEAIISTWPKAFEARAALEMGFVPDASLQAIVKAYIDDHLSQEDL